jgi:hypothetical protein
MGIWIEKDFKSASIADMKYFLYKLIPPRPTFPQDMTETEGTLMQEHVAYLKGLTERRIALIFGPVLDPNGAYGLAILKRTMKLVFKA